MASRGQVLELGATEHLIRKQVAVGEWIRLTSGVYANASSPPTWERQLMAALLDHPVAIAAGRSAACLLGFPGIGSGRPEIMVPYGGDNRSVLGRVIRSRHFDKVATTQTRGFVATTVAETILTMSLTVSTAEIERIIDGELARRSMKIEDFHPILDRLEFARQPGIGGLRSLIKTRSSDAYQPPTSELERLLYRLLDRPQLPDYERQPTIALGDVEIRVDALIPSWSLIVEADGRRWHNRQADHDNDRRRDAAALAAGFNVIRLTWKMLRYEPGECLDRLLAIGRQRAQ